MIVERSGGDQLHRGAGRERQVVLRESADRKILGYTPEEWLETSEQWLEFIHTDDHAAVLEAEEIGIRQKSFQAEYRMRRKDGRMVWISDTAVIIQGSDTHPVMEGFWWTSANAS
jgi:PAS domain S-box-containing protein